MLKPMPLQFKKRSFRALRRD